MHKFTNEQMQQFAGDYIKALDDGFAPHTSRARHGEGRAIDRLQKVWDLSLRSTHERIAKLKRTGFWPAMEKRIEEWHKADEKRTRDPVQVHKHRLEESDARRHNKELIKRVMALEAANVNLQLAFEPLEPVEFADPKSGGGRREIVVLYLSDLHWDEVVNPRAIDGVNCYDIKIARARLARYFQTVIRLLKEHWVGPKPARIILVLGGDLVSGDIHLELLKTNSMPTLSASRDCATHIAAGIRLLQRHVECPIDVISVPGNHGRTTMKPESKNYVANSYDTLVADMVQAEFGGGSKTLTFYKPESGDALVWIYGHRVLITHGDRIGSRGGQGYVGPAATAARGMKKVMLDYSARNIILDFIMIGHFHVALQLEEGIVNGSLVGHNEYARDNRYRPRPPTQAFMTWHPHWGMTNLRWINVGAKGEGTLFDERTQV